MYRYAIEYLNEWKARPSRKPLVVRGARQVGKSFLVREFASHSFGNLVELNLEQDPSLASLFASNQPREIVRLLEARFSQPVQPGRTLLFLDEIQAVPEVFASLRYFFEAMPELHVIAAGSLLEFVLQAHSFSMPVGRIEYLHLGPMRFEEFLLAQQQDGLHQWLCAYELGQDVPVAMHDELLRLLRQYLVTGGMPEAVGAAANGAGPQECAAIQQSILSTYRDDFSKYSRRVRHRRVEKVFAKVPQTIGQKFKYSHVDREERSKDLSEALRLLCLARVAHAVRHTDANGIPLGAEAEDRHFKVLFLDVGLVCRSCGLSAVDLAQSDQIMLVNAGALAEQFVGQHLVHSRAWFEEPELYCWMRQKKSSRAEVDYVIAVGPDVVPVEVKAGKTGRLKSLHLFLREKALGFGLRFNADTPSLLHTHTALADGRNRPFRLLSLPLYMVGQARRLCRACRGA